MNELPYFPGGSWKLVGYFGVDSGLCWIGDPCYILHHGKLPETLGKDWSQFCNKLNESTTNFGYREKVEEGLGICVRTGVGDGNYPVYVLATAETDVAAVFIDFMSIIAPEED